MTKIACRFSLKLLKKSIFVFEGPDAPLEGLVQRLEHAPDHVDSADRAERNRVSATIVSTA